MLSGFAIGILGHVSAARAGWSPPASILIVLGAFLFPLALTITTETPAARSTRILT